MNTETVSPPATEPKWNLYVRISDSGHVDELIMPNEDGELIGREPTGDGWQAVAWPVNPHYTGERMIKSILEDRWPHRRKVS